MLSNKKYILLSNQKCETQPTFINLYPKECSQELYYYPFVVKLDRYVGSCNTLNELFDKLCVPNITEDLHVFDMIAEQNESKIETKDMYCECKFKFDRKKIFKPKRE